MGLLQRASDVEQSEEFVRLDDEEKQRLATLELLRGELAGPNPAPLERLLIERVVTCWLQLHYLELLRAGQDNLSLAQMTFWERCLDRSQNRYLSALKALALVRKLALPVLQVNIAKKQINLAGQPVVVDLQKES